MPYALILTLGLLLALSSCQAPETALTEKVFWDCHYQSDWNYETTKSEVVGSWQWQSVWCCGEGAVPYSSSTEWAGLVIAFLPDGSGIVAHSNDSTTFVWDIELAESDLYSFQTTPPVAQLHGRLLFCQNEMLCNASQIDGANHYFQKVDSGD